MKAFINSYESLSSAGNTQSLMSAIYAKQSSISIDTSYMSETPVGLGKCEYDDFFISLNAVVSEVLKNSNLDNFSETLLIVGSSVGGMAQSEQHYFRDKNYKAIFEDNDVSPYDSYV